MTAKRENLSYHAQLERTDRIVEILTTIGIGEPMYARYASHNDTTSYLTDTGVVVIRSGKDNLEGKIVTMYVATMEQAKGIAQTSHLPNWFGRVIIKNNNKKKGKK